MVLKMSCWQLEFLMSKNGTVFSQTWSKKISSFRGTHKKQASMAIWKNDVLYGTRHHYTAFQDPSWNS